jgi:hypothetical protein
MLVRFGERRAAIELKYLAAVLYAMVGGELRPGSCWPYLRFGCSRAAVPSVTPRLRTMSTVTVGTAVSIMASVGTSRVGDADRELEPGPVRALQSVTIGPGSVPRR